MTRTVIAIVSYPPRSPLAQQHSALFDAICQTVQAARESGDSPSDVSAVTELLVAEAIQREFERVVCEDCQQNIVHMHEGPVTLVTSPHDR